MLQQESGKDIETFASEFINDELEINSIEDALNGAKDIIAEIVSDDADNRQYIRDFTYNHGVVHTSVKKGKDDNNSVYEMYFDYSEKISSIPSHRILAINRAEKEKVISVKLELDTIKIFSFLNKNIFKILNLILHHTYKMQFRIHIAG